MKQAREIVMETVALLVKQIAQWNPEEGPRAKWNKSRTIANVESIMQVHQSLPHIFQKSCGMLKEDPLL
jgi:hypothetical protein